VGPGLAGLDQGGQPTLTGGAGERGGPRDSDAHHLLQVQGHHQRGHICDDHELRGAERGLLQAHGPLPPAAGLRQGAGEVPLTAWT